MSSLGAREERREDADYHRLGDAAHECTGDKPVIVKSVLSRQGQRMAV